MAAYPYLLRVTCAPGSQPGQSLQTSRYYTGNLLDPYQDVTEEVFACAPFELAVGHEIERFCSVAAQPEHTYATLVIIRYQGEGQIVVESIANSPDCPLGCDLSHTPLTVEEDLLDNGDGTGTRRWKLSCTVFSSNPPIQAVLNGTPQALTDLPSPGQVVFYLPFTATGTYDVSLSDAARCEKTTARVLVSDSGSGGQNEEPATWLQYEVNYVPVYDDATGLVDRYIYQVQGTYYERGINPPRFVQLEVEGPRPAYSRSVAEELDRYLLPDGRTLRQAYHNGNGGLKFVDTVPAVTREAGTLELLNLIKTDIDEAGTETGRIWAEAFSPSMPITYRLGTVTNTTGQFDELAPGSYRLELTDAAGRTYAEEFRIEDRYRLRWWGEYDMLEGTPIRYELLLRDYQGPAARVCGGAEPVVHGWQGGGGDPTGNLPEVWGHTVNLSLLSSDPEQFLRLATVDDREGRVDVYAGGQLVFRGYVAPETFRARLLAGEQEVSLLASCGLGALQNVPLLNHRGELLTGRRPLLSTLLHCLSRCDTNLPLYIGSNLREVSMPEGSEPLLQAWGQRTAYGRDAKKLPRTKEALEGILRSLHAVLFQRDGAWWLESASEVDASPARRGFTQEGLPLPAPPPAPPVWHILPPRQVSGPQDLYWLRAEQTREVVPAAAAVQSVVALQLEENLLRNGDFGDWSPDRLRPLQWSVVGGLPVSRVEGEKIGQYAAQIALPAPAGAGLLSAPTWLPDEGATDPVRLRLTLRVPAPPPQLDSAGKDQAPPRVVRVPVQLVYDGVPEPETLDFEFTSADKRDTQSAFIPSGYGGKQLRVQVLPPVLLSGAAGSPGHAVRVVVEQVALDVIPSLKEWPDEDRFTATNYEQGYLLLDEVALTHADTPVLAGPNGLPLSASATGALAWRHALTRPDGSPTRAWQRAGSLRAALPLLETAAVERLELRTTPGEVLTGCVAGARVHQLGVGHLLDAVEDAPGIWLVISCRHLPRQQAAEIVVRKLREGDYRPAPVLTGRVRWSSRGPRVSSQERYRTAAG